MSSTAARPQPTTIRFGHLDITYDDRVLRPRPWTAAQSRWAAELLDRAPEGPVLELCSGAGHIGLLAIAAGRRHLVAVDVDPVAVEYHRRNAEAAGLAERVEIRVGRLETSLEPAERFPLIIADPPWVPTADTVAYPQDPVRAIDGGPDGLEIAWQCVEVARRHLAADGLVLLQLGTLAQARTIRERLLEAHFGLFVAEVRRPDPSGVLISLRGVPS